MLNETVAVTLQVFPAGIGIVDSPTVGGSSVLLENQSGTIAYLQMGRPKKGYSCSAIASVLREKSMTGSEVDYCSDH